MTLDCKWSAGYGGIYIGAAVLPDRMLRAFARALTPLRIRYLLSASVAEGAKSE